MQTASRRSHVRRNLEVARRSIITDRVAAIGKTMVAAGPKSRGALRRRRPAGGRQAATAGQASCQLTTQGQSPGSVPGPVLVEQRAPAWHCGTRRAAHSDSGIGASMSSPLIRQHGAVLSAGPDAWEPLLLVPSTHAPKLTAEVRLVVLTQARRVRPTRVPTCQRDGASERCIAMAGRRCQQFAL